MHIIERELPFPASPVSLMNSFLMSVFPETSCPRGILLRIFASTCVIILKISARNQIRGTVKAIKKGRVSTEVVIGVAGEFEFVSSITIHSAEKMNLREGSQVYAIMKASEVVVGID
jgi:molybdopterin-binding protein